MAAVTSRHDADGRLRLYINGIFHLSFNLSDAAGIQSWVDNLRTPPMFFIEITPARGKLILCEYDREDLWKGALTEIDACIGRPRP